MCVCACMCVCAWTGDLGLPMTSDMTDNPVFRSGVKWVRTGGALLCIQKLERKINQLNGHVSANATDKCHILIHWACSSNSAIFWIFNFSKLFYRGIVCQNPKCLGHSTRFIPYLPLGGSFGRRFFCLVRHRLPPVLTVWQPPYGCPAPVGPAGVLRHCCPAHWSCHGQCQGQ